MVTIEIYCNGRYLETRKLGRNRANALLMNYRTMRLTGVNPRLYAVIVSKPV